MKKIIIALVILIIIAGLGFGGYWLYRKYINPDVSSELEKIEINPDERKELVENLTTKEEKINMIIQLVEDINYERIIYNDLTFNTFHIKDKYEIEYEIEYEIKNVVYGKDYLGKKYASGYRCNCIMWTTGSSTVYLWDEYKKKQI